MVFLIGLALSAVACVEQLPLPAASSFRPTAAPQQSPSTPTLLTEASAAPALISTSTPAPTRLATLVEPARPTPTLLPSPTAPARWLFPDSEVVYSPGVIGFDTTAAVARFGGYLSGYRQYLMITGWTSAAEVVEMVALENSINPRLLLALLEFQSGSLLGQPPNPQNFELSMGAAQAARKDLYGQLVWAAHQLSEGYYGWRAGALSEISFSDGTIQPLDPDLNAGTVALMYFFAQLNDRAAWQNALNPETGFPALYAQLFGDLRGVADPGGDLLPEALAQPPLTLPFEPGVKWAYTGGPHKAFESNGPLAALDFAPSIDETGCYPSNEWVVAMADGLVVRSAFGVVVQDLDGDGYEQTGWNLMYLHIATEDRVPAGAYLHAGDRIGHPSCEGGRATGTHVHLVRKYNGEWIAADSPIPFVLDGWRAHNGAQPYLGTLTRCTETITADRYSSARSHILREENDLEEARFK